MIRDKR